MDCTAQSMDLPRLMECHSGQNIGQYDRSAVVYIDQQPLASISGVSTINQR